jgi:hypothetical protein
MLLRIPPTWRRLLLALGILMLLSGCVTHVMPPPHPSDPRPVFIVDYGRHSSLVLADGRGGLTEYAYGDWEWFALNENGFSDAMRALFYSRHSTLGRRKMLGPATCPAIADELKAKNVEELSAARERVDALLIQLDEQFERHAETRVFNHDNQMWFVQDDEHYALLNNCNDRTARWLKSLGCRIEGNGLSSDFRVVQGPDRPTNQEN